MKLSTQQNVIERSSDIQQTEFTIKATSKAFNILSSGLYSNKILAIVRELSCNAYDAHVAAGKKDVPIEIKLPTALNPKFFVKDVGTGLSHEEILSIYTTYFESTKTNSNDFIGALGLGSKSPFSYTDSFMVESCKDGVLRTYLAYLNEQQIPAISLLHTENTTQCNGIKVSLDVKPNDFKAFEDAILTAFAYFPVKPVINNDPNHPLLKNSLVVQHRTDYQGSFWKLRLNTYDKKPRIIQGVVAYPLDLSVLISNNILTSTQAAYFSSIGLDIFVNVGDVDVAASREQLSYNKHTLTNLSRLLDSFFNEVAIEFEKSVAECDTLWDLRCQATMHFRKHPMSAFLGTLPLKWKGMVIDRPDQFQFNLKEHNTYKRVNYFQYQYNNKRVTLYYFFNEETRTKQVINSSEYAYSVSNLGNHHIFIINDIPNKEQHSLVKKYLHSLPLQYNMLHYFSLADASEQAKKDLDKILSEIGNPPVIYTSELKKLIEANKPTEPKKTKKTNEVYRWLSKHTKSNTYSRNNWEYLTIDLNDQTDVKFYVEIKRFVPHYNLQPVSSFHRTLNVANSVLHTLGFINKIKNVYGLDAKQVQSVKNNPKWVNVFDYINKAYTNNKLVIDSLPQIMYIRSSKTYQRHYDFVEQNLSMLKDSPYKKFFMEGINAYNRLNNISKINFMPSEINSILHYLGRQSTTDFNSIDKEFSEINAKMGLLGIVDMEQVYASSKLTHQFIEAHNQLTF